MKNLVENGYLIQEKAPHDKRSTRVRVSEKGLELCNMVEAGASTGADGDRVLLMRERGLTVRLAQRPGRWPPPWR